MFSYRSVLSAPFLQDGNFNVIDTRDLETDCFLFQLPYLLFQLPCAACGTENYSGAWVDGLSPITA